MIKCLFSHQVVSNSSGPHGLQLTRLPCPSPTPEACSNSCPLSRWCHPTISFSVVPFSSHLQSFPASRSFPVSQFFPSGGQTIGHWSRAHPPIQCSLILSWWHLQRPGFQEMELQCIFLGDTTHNSILTGLCSGGWSGLITMLVSVEVLSFGAVMLWVTKGHHLATTSLLS